MGPLARNLATGLVGLLAALLLGETALRILRPAQLAIVRYPDIYAPDPDTGFHYVPGASGHVARFFEIDRQVRIDSIGLHDDEPRPPRDTDLRVLAVGDSFTAALFLPLEDGWTSVLERALHGSGWPRAEVRNLGLDGTGTDVHLALLERHAPRYAPDVVLLAFYANDFGDVANGRFAREVYRGFVLSYPSDLGNSDAHRQALRGFVDAHEQRWLRRALFDGLYLVRLAALPFVAVRSPYRIEFLQTRRDALSPDEHAGRERVRRAVRDLRRFATGCDCRFFVVPVPPRRDSRGSLDLWQQQQRGARRLPVLDVLPNLERLRGEAGLRHEELFYRYDGHLDAEGSRLFGRAVAEVLLTALERPASRP